MFERVCKEEAMAEGDMRIVVAGAQLVVLAWPENGVIKAFQGVCPHTNTPLTDAEFDGVELVCPIHRWSWSMHTGVASHPHATSLAEYPVKIDTGVIYIDAEGIAPIFAAP
jgi:toluene monooxygenase system ferredoxin subunit